jgi:phospholipid/cholesterol/gamma-HCH transport system substrate-binding protein
LREVKVGLLIMAAFAALGVGIFLIGESSNLFARKSRYFVRFETVAGLAEGNPVQLNGVTVGRVVSIELPEAADERLLTVNVTIDRRFADRVRTDSEARIKTLGLLGDKFIQLTSGTPDAPGIPDGGEIPAGLATDVDQLIASGENAVDNFVAISVSLRNILAGMESGQGILGQLTTDSETGAVARDKMLNILTSIERLTERAERGEGSLGRLLNDDTLARRIEGSLSRLEASLDLLETGEGILPALLQDAAAKDRFDAAVDNLGSASAQLEELARELREGDGLLPRLIGDEEYGREITNELDRILDALARISERIETGQGTAGQLINDPEIYEAVQDIVVGIDESRMLRWLIRNRQKKGIKKRYEEERQLEAARAQSQQP